MSGDRQDKNPAMKIFDNKELKIGIFVILVLAATFLVINYLRNKDIFNREYEVSAVYEDVHGLLPSASVMFKGYKVGQVNEVEYTISDAINIANNTEYDVKLTTNYDWHIEIPDGYTISFDLNGHDVYPIDGGNPFFNYGTLTIINSSSVVSTIGGTDTTNAISNEGKLEINPGTQNGKILVYGTISNDDYLEHHSSEQSITIHDGVEIISKKAN